jgi:hypothetical protein
MVTNNKQRGVLKRTVWKIRVYGFELVYKMVAFIGTLFISQTSDIEILFPYKHLFSIACV